MGPGYNFWWEIESLRVRSFTPLPQEIVDFRPYKFSKFYFT